MNQLLVVTLLTLGVLGMDDLAQLKGGELPLIIAHRGASHAAPENTLAAFKLAWQEGADGIEGDFYLSADRRVVCIHDRNTRRTAGENLDVPEATWDQLQQLDVGRWKAPKYAHERLPDLRQVFATMPLSDEILRTRRHLGKVFIEVKCGPEVVPVLKELLAESPLQYEQIAVISFDQDVIAAVKREMPDVTANWLTDFKEQPDGSFEPSPEKIIETLKRLGADGLGAGARRGALTPKLVKALRKRRYGFHVWTVDQPELARYLMELGVDSLTTNRPGELRRELEKKEEP